MLETPSIILPVLTSLKAYLTFFIAPSYSSYMEQPCLLSRSLFLHFSPPFWNERKSRISYTELTADANVAKQMLPGNHAHEAPIVHHWYLIYIGFVHSLE
jgi:hypothetical protein